MAGATPEERVARPVIRQARRRVSFVQRHFLSAMAFTGAGLPRPYSDRMVNYSDGVNARLAAPRAV